MPRWYPKPVWAAAAIAAGLGLTACDGPSDDSPEAVGVRPVAVEVTIPDTDAARQEVLSHRLMALGFFRDAMWPAEGGRDAALTWLRASAAGSRLELSGAMPEPTIERAGVAVCPVTLRAAGDWGDLVSWLAGVEASPRRIVFRSVELQRRESSAVADVKLAVLVDRPTGLDELVKQDVASLRGEALRSALLSIEAELSGKSRTLSTLGADASWAAPLTELHAGLPAGASPVTLRLSRTSERRALSFAGSFRFTVDDPGVVSGYVRGLQRRDAFAEARLRSLRPTPDGTQRATLSFVYQGSASKPSPGGADTAATAAVVAPR
ncbi:MAG: hypothetical protein AAF710_08305 [Planctomycetota bacterium]